MIEIPLTRGFVAIIDDCDAHLATFKWYAARGRLTWYAHRRVRRDDGTSHIVCLHRVILGVTDPEVEVDHEDGNGLDCRRHNIRAATASQNRANRGPTRKNRSGLKGAYWSVRDRRWQATAKIGGRTRHLGYFATAEEAARAYDAAAREHFGEFARLNFPDGRRP